MSNEELVNALIEKINSHPKKKFIYSFTQKEKYIEIRFGTRKEFYFQFKEYLKAKDNPDEVRERIYGRFVEDIFERVWDLINRDKF